MTRSQKIHRNSPVFGKIRFMSDQTETKNTVVVKLDTFSMSVMDRAPQILLPSPPSPTAGPNQLVR